MLRERADRAGPLTMEELADAFAPLAAHDRLLLAVSGGADSLALMHLVHDWHNKQSHTISLHVATVNHDLRVEAADECCFVAEEARRLGIPHRTLVWSHSETEAGNIQAKARNARYELLADHAQSLGCKHVVTAHHLDDQAETFLMRLIRGSGVTGLGAMQTESVRGSITILRPLLSIPKSRLKASLESKSSSWIEDPSNLNEDFLRVRVRRLLPELEKQGCDAARLVATARRMRRADEALDELTGNTFRVLMRLEPGRALSVELAEYAKLAEEIRLRLIRAMVDHVAAPPYPPREDGLLRLDEALISADRSGEQVKRTCSGCCFDVKAKRLWIYRELGREVDEAIVTKGTVSDWCRLYDIELGSDLEGALVRPLGKEGRQKVLELGFEMPQVSNDSQSLPVALVEALPALWYNGMVIAVADWPEIADKSGLRVDFRGKNTRFTNNQACR